MLSFDDLKSYPIIDLNNEPFKVIKFDHKQFGRGGAIMNVKLKNLITGNILSKTFKERDKFIESKLSTTKAQFLYKENKNYFFMDLETFDQFSLSKEQLGDTVNYIKEGFEVNILKHNGKPINIDLPIKVTLKVISAPPGIKGDTAEGGNKEVELETGLKISVPLFINEGDNIIVDTRNGEYLERA